MSTLQEVFHDLWPGREVDISAEVTRARNLLAMSGEVAPERLKVAQRILAAAGDPLQRPGPFTPGTAETERRREAANQREAEKETRRQEKDMEGENALLGLGADGSELTAAACRGAKADPLEYLSAPGAVLTPAGRAALDTLQGIAAQDPDRVAMAKAQELGIDIPSVRAFAKAAGKDFIVTLKAAVGTADQLAKDLAVMGPIGTGA